MRNISSWIKLAVWLPALLYLWSITRPLVNRSPLHGQQMNCETNLKEISLACKEYMQDYDERFPPVSNSSGQGWAQLFLPYAKSQDIFHCPSNPATLEPNQTDYFYNARLSKTEVIFLEKASQTIIFGDGYLNNGTHSNLTTLPSDWKNNENSPGQRHLGGANYAFADGHVKWLHPQDILAQRPREAGTTAYSFALS